MESNNKNMELSSVKEEPVRAKEKDNKDNKNGSRPKPIHKRRPRRKKQVIVDGENVKPTETNKTKPSMNKPDDGPAHGPTRTSPKAEKIYPIDYAPEYEQNVPTPALTVPAPSATSGQNVSSQPSIPKSAGASSYLPHAPKSPLPYHILFAEASQMCIGCVKSLTSDPSHRCHREIKLHNCERCVHLNKSCISLPRPLRSIIARLLRHRADADFGQQVESVIDKLDVYVYGRHDEGQDETLHLLRSIDRNLFRIANLLKVAADGEEYGEEEGVDEGVFGVM